MSRKITRQSDVIKQWQNLVSALGDNIGELEHVGWVMKGGVVAKDELGR